MVVKIELYYIFPKSKVKALTFWYFKTPMYFTFTFLTANHQRTFSGLNHIWHSNKILIWELLWIWTWCWCLQAFGFFRVLVGSVLVSFAWEVVAVSNQLRSIVWVMVRCHFILETRKLCREDWIRENSHILEEINVRTPHSPYIYNWVFCIYRRIYQSPLPIGGKKRITGKILNSRGLLGV